MTEVKIWVDRVQRVISGVTPTTTVGDLLAILSRSQMLSSPSSSFAGGEHSGPKRDCLVLRRDGMEHMLSPTDRPLRLLAHSGGHLIYRPAAPVMEPQSTVGVGIPLKPGITHVQLRSNAIETALKRQTKSAPLLKPPSVAPKPVQQQPQHLPRLESGGNTTNSSTTTTTTTTTATTTIQMSQLNIKQQPPQQHTTRNLNKTTSHSGAYGDKVDSQEEGREPAPSERLMPPPYEQAIRSSCRRRPADLDLLIRTQQEKLNLQAKKLEEMDREIAILESNLQNRERENVAIYPECQDLDRRLTACEARLNLAQKEEASLQTEIFATKAKIERLTIDMESYMARECELVTKALDVVPTPQQDLPLDEKHRQIVASLQQEVRDVQRQARQLSEQLKKENLKGLMMVNPEELAEGAEGILGGATGSGLGNVTVRTLGGSSRRKVPPKGPRQLGQEMASPTQTHPIGVWV